MEKTNKITCEHLRRRACVYVRQSSPKQVLRNRTSTQLQYELVGRAEALGWAKDHIQVYDADLGVTGAVADQRAGFDALVKAIGLGEAGVIVAFDVTRLARNSVDWLRLFNMCGVCQTLLCDLDGIYDMADYNDRLLVGLKGIMSEAEHHLIRSRLQAAIDKQAEEGTLRKRLPAGYEYQGKEIRKSSNEAIRHVIEMVFKSFEESGAATQVANLLRDKELLLPTLSASGALKWRVAVPHAVLNILHNPTYAGAYTHGRIKFSQVIDERGQVRLRSRKLPQAEWKVLIKDHHPGYITWAQYEQNQQQIRDNMPKPLFGGEGASAVREGKALLQGLLRCHVCGRKMRTCYSGRSRNVQYWCHGSSGYQTERPQCQSMGGARITEAVVTVLLEAIQPASMEVTLKALEKLDQTADSAEVHLRHRVEQARYEASRAERQYKTIEPENRLVARTLETEWNHCLQNVSALEAQLETHKAKHLRTPLSEEERKRLCCVGVDLTKVWNAEETSNRDRKQILRCAFREIYALREPHQIALTLVWEGGLTTQLSVPLPKGMIRLGLVEQELIDQVRTLASGLTDRQVARTLNARGIKTPRGLAFNAANVRNIRMRHGIPAYCPSTDNGQRSYTAQDICDIFGVCGHTVIRWIREGVLVGEQIAPYAPWRITLPPHLNETLAMPAPAGWLPLKKAAEVMHVSRNTVAHWVQTGQVQAVIAGKGRRRGLRINTKSKPSTSQESIFVQP